MHKLNCLKAQLLAQLDDEQQALLYAFVDVQINSFSLEMEAMCRSAFAAAMELSRPLALSQPLS